MKKIYLKKVCSAVALSAVAASMASMTSFAAVSNVNNLNAQDYMDGAMNGFTQEEIDASTVKPVVTVTRAILTPDAAGTTQTVEISVSGAQQKYASSGLHVYFDSRLTLNSTPIGTPDIEQGDGTKYLTVDSPTLDPTASEQGMSGVFMCSAAKQDFGVDGVMWKINFTVPSDAAAGDVYPIDIFYKSKPAAEDLFNNAAKTEEGQLMQAYFFTRSINNGVTSSFEYTDEETAKCAAIAELDASTDGYIAIEDGAPVTTTATTATPTTTATSTTTTKAPTTATAAPTTATAAPTTATGTGTNATGSVSTSTESGTNNDTGTTSKTTVSTTAKPSSTTKPSGDGKDSPKTGVAGVGIAVAGLAVAIGTAFVLRKKED